MIGNIHIPDGKKLIETHKKDGSVEYILKDDSIEEGENITLVFFKVLLILTLLAMILAQ